MKLEGKAKMLRIHFGEDDQWQGRPLYEAIVERCRKLDIAGATVYRGIEGYGASTMIRRSHMLIFRRMLRSWFRSSIPQRTSSALFPRWTKWCRKV